MLLLSLLVLHQGPGALLARLRVALASNNEAAIREEFAEPKDGDYLFEMAKNKGGLKTLKVDALPPPPGWKGYGEEWVVFHTYQDLEDHHDPVYSANTVNGQLRLGKEIPEQDVDGQRIRKVVYRARLDPSHSDVDVSTEIELDTAGSHRAPLFRLGDQYRVQGPYRRAGSLLVPWSDHPAKHYTIRYRGHLPGDQEDRITEKAAYLTSWWIPSIGRLPHPVEATIDAPSNWVVRAEGVSSGETHKGDRTIHRFRCDLPISYPKIVAGKYLKVAEKKVGKETFRIWQLPPIDRTVAARDLHAMVDAAAFYEKTLGPLPFPGYECYDSDTYYGIESYSHTILKKGITTWAIPHEMGHTYFGGLAPCPYVEDSWNESLTQYIDSIVHGNDADKSLEAGLQSIKYPVPLSHMPVAWSYNNTTYMRGAYVMRMLEDEIGRPNVLKGLKEIAFGRRGKNTRWDDLRPYFEKASGTSLAWFWRQWVDNADFPTLSLVQAGSHVIVRQSGTPFAYRLRFAVVAGPAKRVVILESPSGQFDLPSDTPAHLEVFPYTLAKVEGQ